MLARTSTLYALLEQYPFLEDYLAARHAVFDRLVDPAAATRWARVVTLSELATAMNLPWLEFLREVQGEVRRVTGDSPLIIEDVAGLTPDARFEEELHAILGELEDGAPLDDLAGRLDVLTQGLDAEAVAVLARDLVAGRGAPGRAMAQAAGQTGEWPAARLALHPGHPVRALLDEAARLGDLATHVEDLVGGLTSPVGGRRWREARPALEGLLTKLLQVDRQARRLRLAWYPTLLSRGGHGVAALVDADLVAALDALEQAITVTGKGEAEPAMGAARHATGLLRRALAAEEELLAPAALHGLDDDDWEAVAEQERVVGWALARDQAL